jgi:hypothetical protein
LHNLHGRFYPDAVKFTCNIGWGGRLMRIATGLVLLADGCIAAWYKIPAPGIGWTVLQLLMILLGAFAVFEGAIGWCALRAMGIKTRL